MKRTRLLPLLLVSFSAVVSQVTQAAEPLTLENVTAPAPNDAEEPLAEVFSLAAATKFLDRASLDWTENRQCFTCHTNYSYLIARPSVSDAAQAPRQIRSALEELVLTRWPDKGPRWDAEVVMSAAVLALNDAATTRKLHPATETALQRMWTVQREDGGFEWLKCDWPPMESDDYFGATMAAIAVGAAPNSYSETQTAQVGMKRLREYFRNNPSPTLHHTAMLLWADSYVTGLVSDQERKQGMGELLALQKEDGGWALATLGDWERGDGKQQDTETSDGYGTAFSVYVLRRCGLAADNTQIQEGIAWLKTNQRASGRWFTRSLHTDNKHFISHAATAFAVLALTSCDETSAE